MGTRGRIAALATLVAALGSAVPLAQAAASDCPTVFNATIQYELTSASCTGSVCTFVFTGSGGSTLGPVTDTNVVVQDFWSTPCSTYTAEHTFSFANGDTLTAVGSGTVCGVPGGLASFITGTSAVTSGTGTLEGASGTLTDQGVISQNAPVVRFHGTLDC